MKDNIADGLIPAHAGSTWLRRVLRQTQRAHPRSRGEHLAKLVGTSAHHLAHPRSRGEHELGAVTRAAELGSSPLTRGALDPSTSGTLHPGLIPAHAGSTLAEQRKCEPSHHFSYDFTKLSTAGAFSK